MPVEGDYVCVRSDNQGVVWGTLVCRSGNECRLKEARQQYSWGENATTLFDVVVKGPRITKLRLSEVVPEIDMTEICGVILVPQELIKEFKSHPAS